MKQKSLVREKLQNENSMENSMQNEYKPTKYRNRWIEGTYSGWYTDAPGDDNLHQTAYDAMNAIDEQLGGTDKLGYAKRRERGIRIVGKKKKSS